MASLLPRSAYTQESMPSSLEDGKYTGSDMDYTYGDAKQKMQSVGDDVKILLRKFPSHAMSIANDIIHGRGVPGVKQEMMDIVGQLPYNSPLRSKAQAMTVGMLFNSLEHPPKSYLGEKHQYRTADGSHHNFMLPEFGKAGMPYAKTVRSAKKLHGAKPDPGVLFDLLQARDEFHPNEAGISSMFLYHATILIHDLFNTNRQDSNISDTSSYLDLAPLYGSSQEDQDKVRLGKDGLLKPDTFHEDRLLGQPPGVNVLLVMYSRFHNYVATMLKEINEDGRFTERPNTRSEDLEAKDNKRTPRDPKKVVDNDIFQTARLIVGGLYISISLGDYLRAIQGVHEKDTTWTFDPRMYIEKTAQGEAVPRGMGNQVSAEFNLLYRFHPAVSKKDGEWTEDFIVKEAIKRLGKSEGFKAEDLTPREMWAMLSSFAQEKRNIEPCKRNLEDLERGTDGRFPDEGLADILKTSIDDTAGAFGARNVPRAMKIIEVAGIVQARKWEVASLNEFRQFFGLEPHATFADVNADPKIQKALENLYDSPDMIEMYPGIFIEGIWKEKGKKTPGVGFPGTAGRGVLSDAVTLVRSDRFYTTDYTTATLTNWGLCEAQSDYKLLGGSMFHKLLRRGLPGFFDFNSVYAMQPMYTSRANTNIFKRLKTMDQYTLNPPAAPKSKAIDTHGDVCSVLNNQHCLESQWTSSVGTIISQKAFDGLRAFEREHSGAQSQQTSKVNQLYVNYLTKKATDFVGRDAFRLGNHNYQIDIIRDVAIPLNARLLAELFSLNVKTSTNESAAHTSSELYTLLLNVRNWVDYPHADLSTMWYRRRKAQEASAVLTKSTKDSFSRAVEKPWSISSWLWGTEVEATSQSTSVLKDVGAEIAESIQQIAGSHEDSAKLAWMLATSNIGNPVAAAAEVLEFFFSDNGAKHWHKVQKLAEENSPEANEKIGEYFIEAHRLTSAQVCKRTVKADISSKSGTQVVGPNQDVILSISRANHDTKVFPSPSTFKLRDSKSYLHTSPPFNQSILLAFGTAFLKVAAKMDGLRQAPGQMGQLKKIELGEKALEQTKGQAWGRHYMTADWAYLVQEPTTWKVCFDGFGGEELERGEKRGA